MRVRDFFAHISAATMLAGTALAVMAGETAAQFLPPPYSYPPGGYRGAPGPGGVIGGDLDDDDERVERPVPRRRGPQQYSNPYDPRYERDGAPYPIDPRASREQLPPPNAGPGPAPDRDRDIVRRLPWYGPMPPYDERGPAPGAPTARPDGVQQPGLRPPAVIELRPPGVLEPRPPTSLTPPAAVGPGRPTNLASLPPEDQPEVGEPKELPPQFKRQVIPYQTKEPAGSIIIDTPSTYLYYVNGDGTAIRYGIGVGRDGFTWSGTEKISRRAEWPDWHPPAEMIERQPYLPRFMAGGPGNPLGARALYLGKTVYRIHGTNQPSTIGQFVSSGCIRMLNEDVEDLYGRVKLGTRVVVLASRSPSAANIPPAR